MVPEAKAAALVTGGAQRMGEAIVRNLAAHGHPVAIHAYGSLETAQNLADAIGANGGTVAIVAADLRQPEEARTLYERASQALGLTPQILVNNASIFESDSIGTLDDALWDGHFELHVRAPVLLSEAMAAALGDGQDGLVVNVIDQRVLRLTPRFFSYTLSKSAMWTATRTMAQALAPSIRVNAIGPGPTMRNVRQSSVDFEKQVHAVPLRRGPDLAEFGATIRYLWQARSVTGQMIALDGGQHLAWETPDAIVPE